MNRNPRTVVISVRTLKKFTLVELLVVVTIVSILAGLLLPALVKAMESARSAGCTNNLKQIGIGVSMYCDDQRYYPFPYYYPGIWYFSLRGYGDPLKTVSGYYYNTGNLYICPSDQEPTNPSNGIIKYMQYSYGYNYLRLAGAGVNEYPRRPNMIDKHSRTILMTDSANSVISQYATLSEQDRHHGGANVLFLDYSVRWYHEFIIRNQDGIRY